MSKTQSTDSPRSTGANLFSPPATPPPAYDAYDCQQTPPPNLNASNPVSSTPISVKISGNHTFASEIHPRDDANRRLAEETSKLFLGPMPPDSFLNAFLPIVEGAEHCPVVNQGAFDRVFNVKRETQMYEPFIMAVTPFAPRFTFFDTHVNPDTKCDRLATDVGMYPDDIFPNGNPRTDFSRMELFVEFKHRVASDPFRDPDKLLQPSADEFRFEHDADDATLNRGQLASYAAAQMGCQFRGHIFSVLICRNFARFIRWDRSGATVTRRFDYSVDPQILAEFFWRYAHADHRRRGYDTSVSPASPEEIQQAEDIVQEDLQNANPAHREFWKVMVPDRDNAELEKPFIISYPPKYTSRSPFGRATRPMLAFDIKATKLVFLKDYWRPDTANMEKEGDIYKTLEAHHVPNIAPFGQGNDLRDFSTLTQTLRAERWACPSKDMVCLRQYRMSLDVVGRPLTSFTSSWEFVNAIADAMEAHQYAYFKAKILHRDISVGNILITDGGKGILIDWDLCTQLKEDESATSARRPDRTGTWQFISAALLRDKEKLHELEDDRESCLHVLTWVILRYTECTFSKKGSGLTNLLRSFDEAYEDRGGVKGGDLKRGHLLSREIPQTITFNDRPQLQELINELTETFAVRYEKKPPPEQIEALKEALEDNIKPSIIRVLPAFDYQNRLDKLAEPGWLVDTLRRHLKTGSWPEDDAAQPQFLGTGSRTKRTREQAYLELRMPVPKSWKRLDGSGSRDPSGDELTD